MSARDAEPPLGPPSAPGWEVNATSEPAYRDPNRRRARLTLAAGLMCVVGAVAGALVARGRLPTMYVDFRPVLVSHGVDLDDVMVAAWTRLKVQPLTPEQRHRGFNECYLPDPLGLGPYATYQRPPGVIPVRVAIPQQGGHTDDMGFDEPG